MTPMEMLKNVCPSCGEPLVVGSWPFCKGGHAPVKKLNNVIGDECNIVQDNFGPTPEHFTSKSEMARRAKELGLLPFVRHKGQQGSDKSPHTTQWTSVPLDEPTRLRDWHEHEAALQGAV